MGLVKNDKNSPILRLESQINHLWGELNTTSLSTLKHQEIEKKLAGCEEHFKSVLAGYQPYEPLEKALLEIDIQLAQGAIEQAIAECKSSSLMTCKEIEKDLNEKKITPQIVRNEIKEIVRQK